MLSKMLRAVSKKVTVSYIGFTDTPSSFSNVNIGGPGLIVLGISAESSASNTVTSVTVNSITATSVQNNQYFGVNYTTVAIFQAVVTSGSTANISISWSGTPTRARLAVWRLQNYSNSTAISSGITGTTGGSSLSLTLTGMQEGAGVIGVLTSGSDVLTSWTNLTENYDSTISGSSGSVATSASGASTVTTSSSNLAITATVSPSAVQANALAVAAWK